MTKEEFIDIADQQTGSVPLKGKIDLQSVLQGQTFEINFDEISHEEEKSVPKEEELEAFVKACMEVDSDEETLSSTPFERLGEKMINVTEDGRVKKRIRRKGIGEIPPENSVCSILYSSYLEYIDEPIDYAYITKPYQFRLGTACLMGLNIAVASMKVTEKAQFLIHHDFAFGSMGHPPRIPKESTLLLHIELLKFSDSGPALEFDNLTIEDKKKFATAYKTALGLVESAKEHFKKNPKLAIRDYNRARGLLEECSLADFTEQEEQQKLLLRILTNLTVCYNKDNAPKRACAACNDIFHMVKNTSLKVPAKVFYQNGLALNKIGEFSRAKEKLLRAQKIEPQNTEISNLLLKVNEKIKESKKKEMELAKKFIEDKKSEVGSAACSKKTENVKDEDEDLNSDFKKMVAELCDDLIKSKLQQYSLPAGLTVEEIDIVKTEAAKRGLKFRESKMNENDGKLTFFISKM